MRARVVLSGARPSAPAQMVVSAIESALHSVDAGRLVTRAVSSNGRLSVTDINGTTKIVGRFRNAYVVGAGKAAMGMANSMCTILSDRIVSGAITVPYGTRPKLGSDFADRIIVTQAAHPVPDSNGIKGTQEILKVLRQAKKDDLVFVLISGGGSALMPMPAPGLSLADKQKVTRLLVHSGANIQEVNVVRKHLSSVKGGQLPRFANGAQIISLVLSDVIDDDLSSIASGPTFPDSSTFADALAILKKYRIGIKSDPAVKYLAQSRATGEDTPKPGDPLFKNVHNVLIGNNKVACNAALNFFRNHGVNSEYLGSGFSGEAREHGILLARLAVDLKQKAGRFALILGGETTVTINRNHGIGGRNQEAALSCANELDTKAIVACFGTDGIDGNSDAAGAIVSDATSVLARKKDIDICNYLRKHDSNFALKRLNSLLITGPTGTNVNDISIIYSSD